MPARPRKPGCKFPPLSPSALQFLAFLDERPAVRIGMESPLACGMFEAGGRLFPVLTVSALARRGLVEVERVDNGQTHYLQVTRTDLPLEEVSQ